MSNQVAPFTGPYQRTIVDRVPEGKDPQRHLSDVVETMVFDFAKQGVVVRKSRLIREVIQAPAGRKPGLHVRIKYQYGPPTPKDREQHVTARRQGWENGALVRRYCQDGTPDEIRKIPELEVSPWGPEFKHEDREMAIVLDLAWIRGFNAGRKGVGFT